MEEMVLISSGFDFVEIERRDCESFQNYMERCYFIINNRKRGKYSLEELVGKSILYQAIVKMGCKYSLEIMGEIKDMCDYAGIKY